VEFGELYDQIRARKPLPLKDCRQWLAEIIDILAFLRVNQVIHRDLKPENFLLTSDGHLKLVDFGSAKLAHGPDPDGNSFVGTADYVPPEIMRRSTDDDTGKDDDTGHEKNTEREMDPRAPASYAWDYWALGCIAYQMITGRAPFRAPSEYLILQKIKRVEYEELPDSVGSQELRDFITRLLVRDPAKRLGVNGIDELKTHPLFVGGGEQDPEIDWDRLREKPGPTPVLV